MAIISSAFRHPFRTPVAGHLALCSAGRVHRAQTTCRRLAGFLARLIAPACNSFAQNSFHMIRSARVNGSHLLRQARLQPAMISNSVMFASVKSILSPPLGTSWIAFGTRKRSFAIRQQAAHSSYNMPAAGGNPLLPIFALLALVAPPSTASATPPPQIHIRCGVVFNMHAKQNFGPWVNAVSNSMSTTGWTHMIFFGFAPFVIITNHSNTTVELTKDQTRTAAPYLQFSQPELSLRFNRIGTLLPGSITTQSVPLDKMFVNAGQKGEPALNLIFLEGWMDRPHQLDSPFLVQEKA
jgi:hypothetical protein